MNDGSGSGVGVAVQVAVADGMGVLVGVGVTVGGGATRVRSGQVQLIVVNIVASTTIGIASLRLPKYVGLFFTVW